MRTKQIRLTLKKQQYRGDDKWEVTLRGEKKLVTCSQVIFYVDDAEDIESLLNMDEIEDITPDIYPPVEYLPDSDQFRMHKKKKVPFSNMDMMTDRKVEGDFVLFRMVFGWTSEKNPLYRLKIAELFNPINTEK